MGVNELEQVYDLLLQISEILSDIEVKVQELEATAPATREYMLTAQEAIRVLWRFSGLLAHMGMPANMKQAVQTLTHVAYAARMAYMSITLLELGTPYGWIMGLIGLGVVTISSTTLLEGY
jgi:hypothetical protein